MRAENTQIDKSNFVRFSLNGLPVELSDVDPNLTVLDYLRLHAGLKGSKEGCAEGDCGACVVAIGKLAPDEGSISWHAINSCIRFVSSLDGQAVMTVDGLGSAADKTLHPAQSLMVELHASQCGFCTPGFVMSLFALHESRHTALASRATVENALSGNLCRCTGYRPIIDAAMALRRTEKNQYPEIAGQLRLFKANSNQWPAGADRTRIRTLRPGTIDQLLSDRAEFPDAQLIAGCTDVGIWVTKKHQTFTRTIDISSVSELHGITSPRQGPIRIGAAASLTAAYAELVSKWPSLRTFANRFASEPVRNSGTLGGNLANGSPIGDSIALLLALGTVITIGSKAGQRKVSLNAFYRGRQKTVMTGDEVLLWMEIDPPAQSDRVFAYKLSKRFDQDISTVCLAMRLNFENDRHGNKPDVVRSAQIGVGGVAATARRAHRTEQALIGKRWDIGNLERAAQTIQDEFSPITDMRASAAYRRQAIAALLMRAWHESQGETVALEELDP